jgi:hypothetical protein
MKDFWKKLLVEPELVDLSIEFREKSSPEFSQLAIPVGVYRVSGHVCCDDTCPEKILDMLRHYPMHFPNARIEWTPGGEVVAWGKNLEHLWKIIGKRNLAFKEQRDAHRELGRAFGYKEKLILAQYPDDFAGFAS